MRDSLNISWIVVAAIVPLGVAILAARPLWLKRVSDEVGTMAGAAIVLAFSIGRIAREFGHVLTVSTACLELQVVCRFVPEPFTRYAIYAGIGMAQVFALFLIGLSVEERLRRRNP